MESLYTGKAVLSMGTFRKIIVGFQIRVALRKGYCYIHTYNILAVFLHLEVAMKNPNYDTDAIALMVERGAELDKQIKRMKDELDKIKDVIKQEYENTGKIVFSSANNRAAAAITIRKTKTIDPRGFYREVREAGKVNQFFDAIKVTKAEALKIISSDAVERISDKESVSVTITFSQSNA